jgi:hypothetical protein
MFQMFDAMTKGEPFLGRQTQPVKLAYIAVDRSADSVYETMDRVGVHFPVVSLVDQNLIGEPLISKVIPLLTHHCGHRPDFIYIDGFTGMVPDGYLNNYMVVAKWLGGLQRYCANMGMTILGACHTSKTKEGEGFTNLRQKIAGSVAWAGFTETVIIIEPVEGGREESRRVSLLPRNFPAEHLTMNFTPDGKLAPPDKIKHQDDITNFVMEGIMQNFGVGEEITFQQFWNLAEKQNVIRRTMERWINKYVTLGKLAKQGKGVYVIPGPSESTTVQ